MKAAWRMTGRLPKVMGGTWRYLKTSEVLAAAGSHMIAHYIQVRSHSIEKWIADRPIYEMCKSVERSHGATPRTFWLEQPMDLDKVSEGARTVVAAGGDGDGGPRPLATSTGARST